MIVINHEAKMTKKDRFIKLFSRQSDNRRAFAFYRLDL